MKVGVPPTVEKLVDMAIEEDLGRGDVTTRLSVPSDSVGTGRLVSRQALVLSGLPVFTQVMKRVDDNLQITGEAADGDRVKDGDVVAEVRGSIASMLMAERVALNFLQRLSGVATLTWQFVDAVPADARARVTDTRKTTPGMRLLERAAVLHGGGMNHRVDLAGGVLIKENHVAAAGSIGAAVAGCKAGSPHPLKVEIEVRDQLELEAALEAGADIVLLDNMDTEEMARCVEKVAGRAVVEASGGVTLGKVTEIASTGVDVISVGALTHSAPAADLSFLIEGTNRAE